MNPSEPHDDPTFRMPGISTEPAAVSSAEAPAVSSPATPSPAVPTSETPLEPPPIPVAPKIVGYCRDCGQPLYESSAVHEELGAIYCSAHRPAHISGGVSPAASWTAPGGMANSMPLPQHTVSPYAPASYPNAHAGQPWPSASPHSAGASPGLAFVLGLIPGVGAVYNGQYAKGLIHVVVFGLLISVASTGRASDFGPLFGLLIACFYFYMPFEAYHTAKLRRAGVPVDEFSGVMSRRGPSRMPVGPIVLIVIGILFLLSNLDIIEFRRLIRFWPALLIVLGFYMLYERLAGSRTRSVENQRNGQ